jgi:hypothetical protein
MLLITIDIIEIKSCTAFLYFVAVRAVTTFWQKTFFYFF